MTDDEAWVLAMCEIEDAAGGFPGSLNRPPKKNRTEDITVPIKLPESLPRCKKCGKIPLHCNCTENELKK